jgi:predicted regulator of Ras-like GTPase activity (Roadblock/LC7/MglB family)
MVQRSRARIAVRARAQAEEIVMPSLNEATSSETTGEIAGIALADVIQLNQQNRFSGCVAVESSAGNGLLFFRDGEIIHAEQGKLTGEDAFHDVFAWPTGRYRLQPNVTTARSTIQKRSHHLLLDAARLLDERRAGRVPANAPAPPPTPPPAEARVRAPLRSSEVLEKVRRVRGVGYAALHGKDGASVGDDSYEAETLGGQALFLSMIGSQLGALLQAGATTSAVVHGTSHHLLLFATKSHFLSVLVNGEAQVGPVEAEVRRILSGPR